MHTIHVKRYSSDEKASEKKKNDILKSFRCLMTNPAWVTLFTLVWVGRYKCYILNHFFTSFEPVSTSPFFLSLSVLFRRVSSSRVHSSRILLDDVLHQVVNRGGITQKIEPRCPPFVSKSFSQSAPTCFLITPSYTLWDSSVSLQR